MFKYPQLPQPRQRLELMLHALQLSVLRRSIAISRILRRGRLWLDPLLRWWWLAPAVYTLGVIGGMWLPKH